MEAGRIMLLEAGLWRGWTERGISYRDMLSIRDSYYENFRCLHSFMFEAKFKACDEFVKVWAKRIWFDVV